MRSCMCDGAPFFFVVADAPLCALFVLAWGSGFCVAFAVLVLLRVALGLVSGGALGLVVSVAVAGQVLESCLQIALGGYFASVIPCCGLGSQLVCLSSHLRIPNDLTATVAWGSGAG